LFVDSGSNLFTDNIKNSVVDSWWDQLVSKNPGDMFGDWHVNQWEEVLAERGFLCLVPSESVLVNHHEMVHESLFLDSEEAMRVVLLNDAEAGLVIATGGREIDRERRYNRKVC
jgi:hypothetical protein